MSSVISAISSYSTYLLLALLAAAIGWGGYQQLNNDRLEVEVQMYKSQVVNAQTLDELNKGTAAANQLLLQSMIDKQNVALADLTKLSNENSNTILVKIKEQQTTNTAQYTKVSQAINSMNIDTCQGLIDALIQFPVSGASVWGPVKTKP